MLGSVGFTIYANNFGSFGKTYGALGAVVVLMLWLFLTAMAVLVGAEINGEAERQTVEDTTVGHEQPLGTRRAYAADTVGGDPGSDGRGGG
jgi:membrane protein